MKDKISEITLGIRYNRSFGMMDKAGSIVDDILYEDSPFSTEMFNEVVEGIYNKIIKNTDTEDLIKITLNDIILKMKINEDEDFASKYKWFYDDVYDYFKRLFHKYEIRKINRIGILFTHKLENINTDNAIKLLTDNVIDQINTFSLTFSKKYGTNNILYRKKTSDYKNIIFKLEQKKELYEGVMDFQYYYNPVIDDLKDAEIKFFHDAEIALEEKFYKWVEKYG